MSKPLAPLLIAAAILPATAGVTAAQARGSHRSTPRRPGASERPHRFPRGAPLPWAGPGRAASSLGPGLPGGTFTAGAEAQPIGTLPRVLVGKTPQDAVFDAATATVYVANQNDNTVSVVDARSCDARDTSGCGHAPATVAAGNGPFAIGIDDATHTLYVSDSNSDMVSVINAATCNAEVLSGCGQTAATLTVGDGPNGVAVDVATDTVYVANSGSAFSGNGDAFGDTVSVINGATCNATDTSGCGQMPATVKVGGFPFGLMLDKANGTVYVANANDNTVSMIDTARCRAGHTSGCRATPPTAAVGAFPVEAAVDLTSDTIYVGDNSEPTVAMIDGSTCNAVDISGCRAHPATLSVLGGPDSVAVNQATNTLFVANNGPGSSTARANSLSVINAATCNARTTSGCSKPAPTVLTGANPGGLTVDQATNTVFAATFDNSLQVVNGATCGATVMTGCGQPIPATLVGASAFSVAIDQATDTVYVGNSGGEGFPFGISVLDAATCSTLTSRGCSANPTTIPLSFNPYGVAVDQATDTVYASNLFDTNGNPGNTVSVIDGATCNATVTAGCGNTPPTATVGSSPAGIAVNQATDTVYVANTNDNTLSVIDGSNCNATDASGCGHSAVTVPLGSSPLGPWAVAVDQATNTVYVLKPGSPGTVSVIDGSTCNASVTSGCRNVPPTVTVGDANGPVAGLAVDQATDTIYVVNTGDDTASVINGATCNGKNTSGCGQAPPQVAVGRQAFGFVAVDTATDLVYVTNGLDDTVSIVDGARCNATHTAGCDQTPPTVPAGGNPAGIAVTENDRNVYIADNGFGPASLFAFQAPDRPIGVAARAHRGVVTMAWSRTYDGGLPIIYRVIPSPACPPCNGLSTPSTSGIPSTTISGLTPGRTYTFRVQATDAAGTGPVSSSSNPVTP